jgi:glucoamylase
MVAAMLVMALVMSGIWVYRSRHRVLPLLSDVVLIGSTGQRVGIVPADPLVDVFPGTRVVRSSQPGAQREAREQRRWLEAGDIPGAGGPYEELVETALLDVHTLLLNNGALVAAWPGAWHYVWPRDAAFAAVALAQTRHTDDSLRILQFLQRVQPVGGVFQARYFTDASGVPDARGEQSDGTGWVLWAVERLMAALPSADRGPMLANLRQLVNRSTVATLRLTDHPGGLPLPSLDYREKLNRRLSLGTAAPLALGLRAAAALQAELGQADVADQARDRAVLLEDTIRARFGIDDYPRYLGGGEPDAAVAFLLPPFTNHVDPEVLSAWKRASALIRRSGAGLAPGAGWRNDGISWTPQTALFALTAAATGNRSLAQWRLDWLSAHRTAYGALPEKVLSTGRPAGPAPLTWTAAIVVLVVDTLEPDPS